MTENHYRKPGWTTKHVLNGMIAGLTGLGVSVRGSRVLEVTGRRSGQPRRNPVNVLTYDGSEYLVAPRGETEWVRNVRAADGRLVLRLGRKAEARVATEVTGEAKVPVLRAYLQHWKAETGVFFEGVGPDDSDDTIAGIVDRHPVFALGPSAAA